MSEEPAEPAADAHASPRAIIVDALASLRAASGHWATLDSRARVTVLDELLDTTLAAAPAWVEAARLAHDVPPTASTAGEEWFTGVFPVLRHLSLQRRTFEQLERTGRPRPPAIRVGDDGRVVVDVHPAEPYDRMLFARHRVEVRLAPGVTRSGAERRMGAAERERDTRPGRVALVLGAGNLTSIPATDALHQLFALGRVVLLKMSPVNAHLGPHLAEALAPLIHRGVLRIVYGGPDVGEWVAAHPQVDAVHVTGARPTYDAIVRVRGPERPEVTAGLDSVTPVIVVPGPWSRADVEYHGRQLASMLVSNAGFTCVAPRVLVQHRAWAGRRRLMDALRSSLSQAPARRAHHPGARERWERVIEAHPEAERFEPGDRGVPFTLVADLDPDRTDDPLFTTDPFCGITGEVALDAPRSIPAFVAAAVRFCNETLAGTLAVTLLVHPRSLVDAAVALAVDRAIDDLEYGVVAVNTWPGVTFGLMAPPWGPAPGSGPASTGSETGWAHNTFLLTDVHKTVHRAPFRGPVDPLWFHTHRHTHRIGPALARVAATRNRSALASALWWIARG